MKINDKVQGLHTCKFSMNDLSFYTKPIGSIKNDPQVPDTQPNRARNLILAVSFGVTGAKVTNTATGKAIDIKCIKN
jgi:hypothetical protein